MTEPLIYIYADESCLGNQFRDRARPGGAGGVVETLRDDRGWVRRDFFVHEPDTTNNRMAITSARVSLAALRPESRVIFTSDSRYLVDGITKWVHGWVRRGWRRKGGAVENVELWKELLRVTRCHQVDWRWVRGHALHPQNEYAHHLANRAAGEQRSSKGLVPSGFDAWIGREQDEKERYLDFLPLPASGERFEPSTPPPAA